jgi:two-component system cell cycle response regulator
MVEIRPRPVLVLIASHGEWIGRSVESVLESHHYTVVRVESGRRALDLARRTSPDVLILDSALPEMGGIEVCKALMNDPLFDPSVPIFITTPAPVSNRIRAAAYEAGAWDFCSQPLDVETLLLKMDTFLRARRRLEETRASSLVDVQTGLYSERGLHHWATQLGARAARYHEPFACIAITPAAPARTAYSTKPVSAALSYLADVCRSQSRKSDVVGYVGNARFAILAPDTDGDGARQFIGRLQKAVERDTGQVHTDVPDTLVAGFCAVSDFSAAGLDPVDVVRRASSALEHAEGVGVLSRPTSFDELPAL